MNVDGVFNIRRLAGGTNSLSYGRGSTSRGYSDIAIQVLYVGRVDYDTAQSGAG